MFFSEFYITLHLPSELILGQPEQQKVRHRLMAHVFKRVVWLGAMFITQNVFAHCYKEAGSRYGIDPLMLKAIAITESSVRPNIESLTQEIGLMGINRSWLPILSKRYGLSEQDVWQPCTNVQVGAWILASNYRQFGKNWNAVGAYNAACKKLNSVECKRTRLRYSQKVYDNLKQLKGL